MAIDLQTLIHLVMFIVALGVMYLGFLSDSL